METGDKKMEFTKQEMEYARKPLACSSPIVTDRNGITVRLHDGYSTDRRFYTVDPSEFVDNTRELGV